MFYRYDREELEFEKKIENQKNQKNLNVVKKRDKCSRQIDCQYQLITIFFIAI